MAAMSWPTFSFSSTAARWIALRGLSAPCNSAVILCCLCQNHGITENLADNLENAAGCLAVAFFLDGFDDGKNILRFQPRNVPFAYFRKNVGIQAVKHRSRCFAENSASLVLCQSRAIFSKLSRSAVNWASLALFFCSDGSMPLASSPLASSRLARASFRRLWDNPQN